LIGLGAFCIADTFFGVFGMAVDTIFLCFLEDVERNDGSQEKPYFMSRDLHKVMRFAEEEQEEDETEDDGKKGQSGTGQPSPESRRA